MSLALRSACAFLASPSRVLVAWILGTCLGMAAPHVAASVYFKYRVVAETGQNGFIGLGNGPSINDAGKVAFIARFSNGDSVFLWKPTTGLTDIATNFRSSTRSFGEGAQINDNDEVATWSRITGATPIGEVRVFRAGTPNDNSVMVRALPGFFPNSYDTLFPFPSINNTRLLEDRNRGGNLDGVCDSGETCVSQIAYGAFRAADSPPRYLGTIVKNPQSASEFGQFHEFSLNTSLSRPMVADDGSIVIRGRNPTDPIQLFNYALGAPLEIAGSSRGFTALGLAPSITDLGGIVAFAGNRGKGDGVFLSIPVPNNQRRLVRIAGENLNFPKSELGVDGTGGKLYFQSIELDSRVGITYTPDYDGNARGSVVVTFVGTPSAGGRINPGTGKPFLFTGQKGLWSMRIDLNARLFEDTCVTRVPGSAILPPTAGDDTPVATGIPYIKAGTNGICETDNDERTDALFSRTSPLPVVQIGDTLHNAARVYTISAFAVNDPVAGATYDSQLQLRSARLGDHRVVFWAQSGADQLVVSAEHLDSDQDGLLDHWETEGIDLEGTGTIDLDLPAMGADPNVRDLFVQMDFAMNRSAPANIARQHVPAPGVIRQFAQHMASAPALANGVPAGIRLHVDAGSGIDGAQQPLSRNMGTGPLRGGHTVTAGGAPVDILYFGLPNTVTFPGVNAIDFDTVKVNNFWSSHRGAREFAFLHIVFADFHHGVGPGGGSDNVNPVRGTATAGASVELHDAGNPALSNWNFAGHAIKITGGTGAGQLRTIQLSGVVGVNTPAVQVNEPWNTIPDNTSTYILLDGSAGEGNAGIRSDGAFSPGRSLAITLGGYGVFGNNLYQGNFRDEWQTLVHEVGHLLTLMHGGTNHNNYKPGFVSLMNYAYENCGPGQVGTGPGGSVLAGAAACPVDRYSGHPDAVFADWEHLDLKGSLNFARLGQAFGPEPGSSPPNPPPPDSRTRKEIEDQFGPQDSTPPAVALSAPANGALVIQGSGIAVSFSASDNVAVVRSEVHFDVNGDGSIDEATEVFPASGGPGAFSAAIPALSGPNGPRALSAFAYDAAGNPGFASVTIHVGSVTFVNVPNVASLTQAAATASLNGAGLVVGTVSNQGSATVPAGSVISQSPAAGASVAAGSAVTLVVSIGSGSVTVPNVIGQTQAAASSAITGAGLTVGTLTSQASVSVPAGSVISQTPVAGTSVAAGSAVALVVSSGAPSVTVPNVVGQTQAAAMSTINGASLTVGTVTSQTSASVPAGTVISQNPAAGASVAAGSAVNLVVSTGPPVTVPDVVGLTQAAAASAITGAGLTTGTVTGQASETVPAGSVIAQNPVAGASVAFGSAVILLVSTGPPPTLSYTAVTPCRLLDTRNAAGPLPPRAGRSYAASDAVRIAQAGGNPGGCGIPMGPSALALTLTAVLPEQAGNLVAYAAGGAVPLSSALNFLGGQIIANTTIVPITPGGGDSFSLFNNSDGNSPLVADVVGFFWTHQAADCNKQTETQAIGPGASAIVTAGCGAGFVGIGGGCGTDTPGVVNWLDRRNTPNGLGFHCSARNASGASISVTTDTLCCRKAGR